MKQSYDAHLEERMMYLCLVYLDEARLSELAACEREAVTSAAVAYGAALAQGGHFLAAAPLQPAEAAATIRVRGATMSITPGAATDDNGSRLGGYYLIDATDLNDAIRTAARMPPARAGCIEIRPVVEQGSVTAGDGPGRSSRRTSSRWVT